MEHAKDHANMIAALSATIQEQISIGSGNIYELEGLFSDEEISKILPVRDAAYARAWLRNV
jgi:hypothetical protein